MALMIVKAIGFHLPTVAKHRYTYLNMSVVGGILDDLEQRGGLKASDVANILNASRLSVSR